MGDFSEHVLFGFLTAAVVAYMAKDLFSLNIFESSVSVMAVLVGSIFPDIDHKNSYIHRSVKAFASILASMAVFLLPLELQLRYFLAVTVLVGVYYAISRLDIRHRGFAHSISFCTITASLFTIFTVLSMGSALPGIALGIGLLSHLLLDREL